MDTLDTLEAGTIASLFSGGGGWEAGGRAVGLRPVLAVECVPWIAAHYGRAFGDHAQCASVADVDYAALGAQVGPVRVLVSSPPCQKTSPSGKAWVVRREAMGLTPKESAVADGDVGIHTLAAVEGLKPAVVLLENNAGYERTEVFAAIRQGLLDRGYVVDHAIVRAESHGSPSGRERLILRASKAPLPPWPKPTPMRSWWDAIADLVPDLPVVPLAPWQEKALRDNPPPPGVPLLIAGGNPNRNARGYVVHRTPDQPAWTTQLAKNTSGMRVVDAAGVVRLATARVVARLQGFPDWYPLDPLARADALHILGNSVPPVLATALLGSVLGGA